jgi:hypothetical protein
MALKRVSNETVKYGREFCGIWIRESLLGQGPEEIVRVNYRPILSSERTSRNPQLSDRKINLVMVSIFGARHQDRLVD